MLFRKLLFVLLVLICLPTLACSSSALPVEDNISASPAFAGSGEEIIKHTFDNYIVTDDDPGYNLSDVEYSGCIKTPMYDGVGGEEDAPAFGVVSSVQNVRDMTVEVSGESYQVRLLGLAEAPLDEDGYISSLIGKDVVLFHDALVQRSGAFLVYMIDDESQTFVNYAILSKGLAAWENDSSNPGCQFSFIDAEGSYLASLGGE